MKIIYLDIPRSNLKNKYTNSLNNNDFNFTIRDSFSSRFAQALLRYKKGQQVEVWGAYNARVWGDRGAVDDVVGGITYRSFPYLELGNYGVVYPITKALNKLVAAGEKFVAVLQNLHTYNNYLIMRELHDVPLIIQQRSHIPPSFKNSKIATEYHKSFIRPIPSLYERKLFSNIDYAFCNGKFSSNYVGNIIGDNKAELRHNTGFYFDEVKNIKEKFKSDRTKIMGTIRFNPVGGYRKYDWMKGVRQMAIAFNRLSKKIDCDLTLFGQLPKSNINAGHKLHNLCMRMGIETPGKVPHSELLNSMQQTDLNWTFVPGLSKYFGGVTSSSIESMAHNVPQINNAFVNFQGNNVEKLGLVPNKTMDLVNNSLEIVDNNSRYRRVREVSKRIYDWQVLTSVHYDKYKEIYENYF